MTFVEGQRIMITDYRYPNDPEHDHELTGYYGHITEIVDSGCGHPLYYAKLTGALPSAPFYHRRESLISAANGRGRGFPFYGREIEAAD